MSGSFDNDEMQRSAKRPQRRGFLQGQQLGPLTAISNTEMSQQLRGHLIPLMNT
jgi:hypothetical protein